MLQPLRTVNDKETIVFEQTGSYSCFNVIATNLVIYPGASIDFTCSNVFIKKLLVLGQLRTTRSSVRIDNSNSDYSCSPGYHGQVKGLRSYGLEDHQISEILRRVHITASFNEIITIPGNELILDDTDTIACRPYCEEDYCKEFKSKGLECDLEEFYHTA